MSEPCKDCQKNLIKYIPWVITFLVSWNSYVTEISHRNDRTLAKQEVEIAENKQGTKRNVDAIRNITISLELQKDAFNQFSRRIEVLAATMQQQIKEVRKDDG